jgi:hypothetical protein
MTRQQQYDDYTTYYDAIDTESLEAIFRKIVNEPLHSEERHDKGDDTT